MPLLWKVEEAARDVLRLSGSEVYELIRTGEIESVKIGRSRRIPQAALEAFVEQLRASAPVG